MLRHAVSEFAPASPWKEILLVFIVPMLSQMPLIGGLSVTLCYRNLLRRICAASNGSRLAAKCPGAVKIGLRIDAKRHGLHDFDIDAHSSFKARNCSSFSRFSSGDGPSFTKRSRAERR